MQLVPQVRKLFPASTAFCILSLSSQLPDFFPLLYHRHPCQPLLASRTHPAPYLQVGKLGESLFTPRVSTFVGSVPGVDTVEEEEHKREAVSRQAGQTARACCCEGDDVASMCCSSWTKRALPSSRVQLEVGEDRQSSRFQRVTRIEEQELMNAWTAQHVSYQKCIGKGSGDPGSLLQAQESLTTKRNLFSYFHSTKKAALFPLRIRHSNTFPFK